MSVAWVFQSTCTEYWRTTRRARCPRRPSTSLGSSGQTWSIQKSLQQVVRIFSQKLCEYDVVYHDVGVLFLPARCCRYHSFYPWHTSGDYTYLCDEHDMNMLKWINRFKYSSVYLLIRSKAQRQFYVDLFMTLHVRASAYDVCKKRSSMTKF